MSEHLTKMIQKIDFNQSIDQLEQELTSQTTTQVDEEAKPNTQPIWLFETVRRKLVLALTEICVLHDVLSIAKQKKYMVFNSVSSEQPDHHPIVDLMAKKKAFQTASQILLLGAESLRSTSNNEPNSSFYDELIEMRKNWRLKLVGNQIIGDLSYCRTASRFANSKFEAMKTTPEQKTKTNQAITVQLPLDLTGKAHIQVSIIKGDEINFLDIGCSYGEFTPEASTETRWQEKLETAQDVLFCRDLFNLLAKEAVSFQFNIPTTVTGNQIVLSLFPDVKLYISLIHSTCKKKSNRPVTEGTKKLREKHNPVFEHSLHLMLRDYYTMYVRKMQSSRSYDVEQVGDIECFLEQIVMQSQHLVLRQQTMGIIDEFSRQVKDPMIVSHWLCLNHPKRSLVRVDIVSKNNEALGRTHMLIYIETRELRIVTRECKHFQLGYESEELRNVLKWQCCFHQFTATATLCKLIGWHNLVARHDSESSPLVMLSPSCGYIISVKFRPLSISVAKFNELGHGQSYEELNRKVMREVDFDRMRGRDFISKIEYLMAALTSKPEQ